MKIQVSKEHIKKGSPTSCFNTRHNCPIGRALRSAGLGFLSISWQGNNLVIHGEKILPDRIANILHNIQYGKKVKPFIFNL